MQIYIIIYVYNLTFLYQISSWFYQPTLVAVSRIYQCLGDFNLMLATLLSHFYSEFIQHESDYLPKVLQKLEFEYPSWVMCHLQRAMLLWMMDAAQRDAMLLYEAMQGIGTKDSALIGIMCSRTPSQLYAIKQAYHTMYRRTLEHHIDGDTSGDYRKVSKRNKNPKFISIYVAIFRHQLFFWKNMYI